MKGNNTGPGDEPCPDTLSDAVMSPETGHPSEHRNQLLAEAVREGLAACDCCCLPSWDLRRGWKGTAARGEDLCDRSDGV